MEMMASHGGGMGAVLILSALAILAGAAALLSGLRDFWRGKVLQNRGLS